MLCFASQIAKNLGYEVTRVGDVSVGDAAVVTVKVRKAVKETVLHITFETQCGEVVGNKTISTTAQGIDGEAWSFMLGTDFDFL